MKKYIILTALILSVNLAYSGVVILNGLTHFYSGTSGDQLRGEIVLLNNSNEEQIVRFSLNDAIFSCTEDRIFSQAQTHSNSSLQWFEGSLMDLVLDPNEKYTYRFVINIPKNEKLKGSYWSAIMIDVDKPIKKDKISKTVNLDTKVRYAIGLLTNVNTYDEVSLDFQSIDIKKNETKKNLEIKIINNSLFIEGVKLTLEVYDSEGKNILETTTKRSMVFPSFCKDFKVDISELSPGNYECILVADSRDEFAGTNISLTID